MHVCSRKLHVVLLIIMLRTQIIAERQEKQSQWLWSIWDFAMFVCLSDHTLCKVIPRLCKDIHRLCEPDTQRRPSDGHSLWPYSPHFLKISSPFCTLRCVVIYGFLWFGDSWSKSASRPYKLWLLLSLIIPLYTIAYFCYWTMAMVLAMFLELEAVIVWCPVGDTLHKNTQLAHIQAKWCQSHETIIVCYT